MRTFKATAKTGPKKQMPTKYEVDFIFGKRPDPMNKGKFEYQVFWKGYAASDATWEPEDNLRSCRFSILAYEQKQQQQQSGGKNNSKKGNGGNKNKKRQVETTEEAADANNAENVTPNAAAVSPPHEEMMEMEQEQLQQQFELGMDMDNNIQEIMVDETTAPEVPDNNYNNDENNYNAIRTVSIPAAREMAQAHHNNMPEGKKHFHETFLGFIHHLMCQQRTDQSLELIELNYPGNFQAEHPQVYMRLLVVSLLEQCVQVATDEEEGKQQQPEMGKRIMALGKQLKQCIAAMEQQQEEMAQNNNGNNSSSKQMRRLSKQDRERSALVGHAKLALELVWSRKLAPLLGHPLWQKHDEIATAACDLLYDY